MQITVSMFAAARELAGCSDVQISLDEAATVADALRALIDRFPNFQDWRKILRVAVNEEYAAESTMLHHGDRIALIPPVSGG